MDKKKGKKEMTKEKTTEKSIEKNVVLEKEEKKIEQEPKFTEIPKGKRKKEESEEEEEEVENEELEEDENYVDEYVNYFFLKFRLKKKGML